jgi:chemotaxis signal transduction protein
VINPRGATVQLIDLQHLLNVMTPARCLFLGATLLYMGIVRDIRRELRGDW